MFLKTKNTAIMRPSNPTPKCMRLSGGNHNSKGCMHPSVHCSTIYSRQDRDKT